LPGAIRAASVVVLVEALGLAGLAVVDAVKALTGAPRSVVYALLAAGLAVGTSVVLIVLARAIRRLRHWAYVPVLVLQGLALPVGYSLAVQARLWLYGGPVLLLALVEIALLLAPESRRALGPG